MTKSTLFANMYKNLSMENNKSVPHRVVARYVTTVNQLYISLLILGYIRYLPHLCGKKSGRLYNELRNESSLELKLLLC